MNYEKVALEVASLLKEKNEAYGDAINRTSKIMEILYPNGIEVKDYQRILMIVRIVDKLCRESVTPAKENAEDLSGYGLRMLAEYDNARHVQPITYPQDVKPLSVGKCIHCGKLKSSCLEEAWDTDKCRGSCK